MSNEANVVGELYRHLQNTIDEGAEYHSVTFGNVDLERNVPSGGYADVVIETDDGRPFAVVEAKREPVDEPDRDIDPYSEQVVRQAVGYAIELGTDYFATYNGRKLVIYRTLERGTDLLDRKTSAYEISSIQKFAPEFLEQLAGIDRGVVQWDPHREAFAKRLKTFHDLVAREFRKTLFSKLNEDDSFSGRYEEWVKDQGRLEGYEESPEDVNISFSSQASYLLLNKLVFYRLLRDASAYTDIPEISLNELTDPDSRAALFNTITEQVDFEAVYDRDPIFDSLQLTERAQREVSNLLSDLEKYDLRQSQFDNDVIGDIYEEIIPPAERYELGQYYTPKEIVELITKMTITDPSDVVLDPGCGSGGFLVGAYQRLAALEESKSHREILDQLHGVDVNRFPAHLSAINLALQNLDEETHDINLPIKDFFDIQHLQASVSESDRASIGSNESQQSDSDAAQFDLPHSVDVAIANPPYIRNEHIGNSNVRNHLENIDANLAGNSDIYCYFFTHAFEFLQSGTDNERNHPGRMGFLTSNRWLTADYGESLQEFFLNRVRIQAVIDFQTQQFEVPLIGTCVTVLELCDNKQERENNIVDLLLVKDELSSDEIVSILDEPSEAGTLHDGKQYRRVSFRQRDLAEMDRWDRYLYAPDIYWDLVEHPRTCELVDIASVSAGKKTGANDYFYFEEKESYANIGIDDDFITPILKHISPTDYINLQKNDPHWYILDLNSIISDILEETRPSILNHRTSKEVVIDEFESRGWDSLIQYIEYGEEQDVDEVSSVQGIGKIWFDCGGLPIPQLILPKEYWRDPRVLRNEAKMPIDQRNHMVDITSEDVDEFVLLGVLNSSILPLVREIEGEQQQGQGMNRNQLTVTDAKELHIPDPREFSDQESNKIKTIMKSWLDVERTASDMREYHFRSRLDEAVLEAMGLEDRCRELRIAVKRLLAAREEGAGENTTVLVSSNEERDRDLSIPGARLISNGGIDQRSLDSF